MFCPVYIPKDSNCHQRKECIGRQIEEEKEQKKITDCSGAPQRELYFCKLGLKCQGCRGEAELALGKRGRHQVSGCEG